MSLFQSNLRKQIRKLPNILKSDSVKIIQYYSSPFSQSSFQIDPNSNEYLLAKIGVDTAENEPLEVWAEIIQYYSFVSLDRSQLGRGVRTSTDQEDFAEQVEKPRRISCQPSGKYTAKTEMGTGPEVT